LSLLEKQEGGTGRQEEKGGRRKIEVGIKKKRHRRK
jgi:hypothetical protein